MISSLDSTVLPLPVSGKQTDHAAPTPAFVRLEDGTEGALIHIQAVVPVPMKEFANVQEAEEFVRELVLPGKLVVSLELPEEETSIPLGIVLASLVKP